MFGHSALVITAGVSSTLFFRNLYYTRTFNGLISRAKQQLEPLHLEDSKETLISKQEMLSGSYEQLDMEAKHEFAFALKPGFEEELGYIGIKTPFYHTSCAYAVVSEEGTKWLVYGRQSPKFRTKGQEQEAIQLERNKSPLETKADNEKHYTLLERHPEDHHRKIYRLLRTGVYFSKSEIKQVIEKANQAICGNVNIREGLNTFITSNCYTFSVFCLTEYINLLLQKHQQPDCQKANILKLYKILLDVCTHPVLHGQGIANNGIVRRAVFTTIEKMRNQILPAPPVEDQPEYNMKGDCSPCAERFIFRQ